MNILLLRFDAPLISFGSPTIDQYNKIQPFPTKSMLTGLLGNALGWHHSDYGMLQRLQARIRFAVRRDRTGEKIVDFQTVDLTDRQVFPQYMWTTRGQVISRSTTKNTHIRYKEYWADCCFLVALTLDEPSETPTLDYLEKALIRPARPLFLGRKCCLPASPIFLKKVESPNLLTALWETPLIGQIPQRYPKEESSPSEDSLVTLTAWWSPEEGYDPTETTLISVVDEQDWVNRIHVGERSMVQGTITVRQKEVLP